MFDGQAPVGWSLELACCSVVELARAQLSSSSPAGQSRWPLQSLARVKQAPLEHWKACLGQAPGLHSLSSLPSAQLLCESHTKYHEMHWPLRHWKVSRGHPFERAEQPPVGRMHSQTPPRQSLFGSRAWHWARVEQDLPSELTPSGVLAATLVGRAGLAVVEVEVVVVVGVVVDVVVVVVALLVSTSLLEGPLEGPSIS